MNADDWMDQMDLQSKAGNLERLIKKLTEQNKALQDEVKRLHDKYDFQLLCQERDKLTEQNKIMREALDECRELVPSNLMIQEKYGRVIVAKALEKLGRPEPTPAEGKK